jgi:outer membrane lipoprotein-sorting protein
MITRVLNPPAQTYQGHLMMTSWSGGQTRAEDVSVYYRAPNAYRLEFLSPNGTVDRAVVTDGSRKRVQVMQAGHVTQDFMTPFAPSSLSREDEKNLVIRNYRVVVKGETMILGRSTVLVELTPLAKGKPLHQLRIDRETSVVLEAKEFNPDGKSGSLMRFTEFHPKSALPDSLFLAPAELDASSPEYTRAEPTAPTGPVTGGFMVQGVDYFDVTGKSVRHVRYTDGVLPLSLFETPLPVRIPQEKSLSLASERPLGVGFSTQGRVCSWKKNNQYFTLIGDVQEDLLKNIADTIK